MKNSPYIYIKILRWPIIVVFVILFFNPEISVLIKNIEKIKMPAGLEIETKEKLAILDTTLKEKEAKQVRTEDIYGVVKTVKEFENAIRKGKKSELEKYFSSQNRNREQNIKGWSNFLKTNISLEVEDINQYGTEIKASVKINTEGNKWEEPAFFIKEEKKWKFLK